MTPKYESFIGGLNPIGWQEFLAEELAKEYRQHRRALMRRTLKRVFWCLLVFALLLLLVGPAAAEDSVEVRALTAFEASGEKTPIGEAGVYSDDYGRRIGTIERLADGSTVMRGDYGRIVAKVEPRRSKSEPLRITVRDKK